MNNAITSCREYSIVGDSCISYRYQSRVCSTFFTKNPRHSSFFTSHSSHTGLLPCYFVHVHVPIPMFRASFQQDRGRTNGRGEPVPTSVYYPLYAFIRITYLYITLPSS